LTKKNINKLLLNALCILGWGLLLSVIVFRTLIYKMGLTAIGLDVSLLAVGTACILIWMQKHFMDGHDTSSRFTLLLCFFGRNSYEVYLTHMFVVFTLTWVYSSLSLAGEWAWMLYISTVLMAGVLGEFVAKYFSNPLNRMLRRQWA
jgi:peptidoglycan/LPS O-acetylase OafA/YrhL